MFYPLSTTQARLHTSGSVRFEQLPQLSQLTTEKVLTADAQGNIKATDNSQLKDNLGNHIATQNLQLGQNWLSPDGSNKGIQLKNNGNVQINEGFSKINVGKATGGPLWLSNYIGFNAYKQNNNEWYFDTDGANNGGAIIACDVKGNMRIVNANTTYGNVGFSKPENELPNNTRLLLLSSGKVGINTPVVHNDADVQIKGSTYVEDKLGIGICLSAQNNPKNYRLAVNGAIGAKDVFIEIDETPWPDYVFEPEHILLSLTELEAFIKQYKHLPDIPSANDVKEHGLSLAEINALLLKKIEELTLYIIELNKKIEKYENHN